MFSRFRGLKRNQHSAKPEPSSTPEALNPISAEELSKVSGQYPGHKKSLTKADATTSSDSSLIKELHGKLFNDQESLAKLQAQLEESSSKRDTLLRMLMKLSEKLKKSHDRIKQLEARQSTLLEEKEAISALRESDSRKFEVKLEAATSRARLAEQLLEMARSEQRISYENQSAQTALLRQIRNLETTVDALQQDLKHATRRNLELENFDNIHKAKTEDLQAQVRSLQHVEKQSSDKIKRLQELLEAVQIRHNDQTEQYEEQIRQLTEQVGRERSDRVYLENELEAARREINLLQAIEDIPEIAESDMAIKTRIQITGLRPAGE